jgi:hypothetical protein
MSEITYQSKDQNYQDETTIYWFSVDESIYGVSDCNGEMSIVDYGGCSINTDDECNMHLKSLCGLVTEEMINE